MLTQLRKTILTHGLLARGDRVLIAVSGGPDSLALLYGLCALRNEFRLDLHVAHLDHKLRAASGRDRAFVEKVCRKLGVPCTSTAIDCRKLLGRGSVEEVCRNVRLKFLSQVSRRIKADNVALAHTFDDQAETVLMRILRGTGLAGLSGILPVRTMLGMRIIRPLLETRRVDIERFLRRKKITPRIDSTNLRDIYFRNKVRNRLMPLLQKEYSRSVKELLANLAFIAASDYDYIRAAAERALRRNRSRVALRNFHALHPAVARMLVRLLFARLVSDSRSLTVTHIREIEDLVRNRPTRSVVDLPGAVSIVKTASALVFRRRS